MTMPAWQSEESGAPRVTCVIGRARGSVVSASCLEMLHHAIERPQASRPILGVSFLLEVCPFRNVWSHCSSSDSLQNTLLNRSSILDRLSAHPRCAFRRKSKCSCILCILSIMCQSKHYNSILVLESKSECPSPRYQCVTVPSANSQLLYPNAVRSLGK